jgi:hypothetical protein
MIVDVFIMVAIVAFILLVIAYQEASIAWTSLSLLMWIFLMALSFNIEIPYQAAVDIGGGAVNITTGSQQFFEPALSMVCFGIIIFNVILLLVDVMDYQNRRRYRI